MTGAAEKLLILHKDALESALSKLCTRKAVKCIEELLLDNQNHVLPKPRYVRVNTLKINTETAIQELERIAKVKIDDVVPDMLVLPGGTDLHNHRLVLDGSIFLQVSFFSTLWMRDIQVFLYVASIYILNISYASKNVYMPTNYLEIDYGKSYMFLTTHQCKKERGREA
ncbi:uncharacterized protein LOC110103337 [Dendrobium catenatum]|uniref:uncharacterized protein LOC110103337 n=1 Tax=Dendrobium catenatum TaxID=906689 RepID=UPI00109F5F23|nr:uncharacterized protein LOC110103337 [Dendrobium catenatum]